MLWEHLIRGIVITEARPSLKNDNWRISEEGRKASVVSGLSRITDPVKGESMASIRNWKVNVTEVLRIASSIVYVEGYPYPKNNGKWFKYLKQELGHSLCYFKIKQDQKQTNNKKFSLEHGEAIRVKESKRIQVDQLRDFCNCAEHKRWWFGQSWQMLKWW